MPLVELVKGRVKEWRKGDEQLLVGALKRDIAFLKTRLAELGTTVKGEDIKVAVHGGVLFHQGVVTATLDGQMYVQVKSDHTSSTLTVYCNQRMMEFFDLDDLARLAYRHGDFILPSYPNPPAMLSVGEALERVEKEIAGYA